MAFKLAQIQRSRMRPEAKKEIAQRKKELLKRFQHIYIPSERYEQRITIGPRSWRPGNLYYFNYLNWHHDPYPLVLAIGYNPKYHTVEGLNLHYITPKSRREQVVMRLLEMWKARIGPNSTIQVSTREVFLWAKHFYGYVFYRRYKYRLIKDAYFIPARDELWEYYIAMPKRKGKPFTTRELLNIRRGIARIVGGV